MLIKLFVYTVLLLQAVSFTATAQDYKMFTTSDVDQYLVSSVDPNIVVTMEICSPLKSAITVHYSSYDLIQGAAIQGTSEIQKGNCTIVIGSQIWLGPNETRLGVQYKYLATTPKRQ